MNITDEEIRECLQMGEDNRWEFKQIEFRGSRPVEPKREVLADEMVAFANSEGGILLCGISDEGQPQGMSPKQMTNLDHLLAEVSTDAIEPPLRIKIYRRKVDKKNFVLVDIPQGDSVHDHAGRAFIRVGASKRRLGSDERLRLAQKRAQSRYMWFDQQVVPQTGFESLNERLWEPFLSIEGAKNPLRAMMKQRLLGLDEDRIIRATVAGVLLCTDSPQEWLPQATIMATLYRGEDRASGQLDAQEIEGPLPLQIADAMKFVVRNMRVAARKIPARENMPQYSKTAIFEAMVNAVVHRDYSVSSRRIRLSMFKDRLEIDSPGQLLNGMTVDGMDSAQSTRNEVLASVFGRLPVGDIPGSEHRLYMMERRGDGVSIIRRETYKTSGIEPEYRLINGSNLVLYIQAARLELTPSESTVTIHSKGNPLPKVDVLILFPNRSWQKAITNGAGEAKFELHTTQLPISVYAATPGYGAGLAHEWIPQQGGLSLELSPLEAGGSVIFLSDIGRIPGLNGQLNPVRDTLDRTYLYADNITIDQGRQQPVPFRVGKPLRLTDNSGAEMSVTIVDIIGKPILMEYKQVYRHLTDRLLDSLKRDVKSGN